MQGHAEVCHDLTKLVPARTLDGSGQAERCEPEEERIRAGGLEQAPGSNHFRSRLLEEVRRSPEYADLTKTEQSYLDQMIGLANTGGEIHVKHDELADLMGQCRRNVIRVVQRLVDKGLLTVGPRYRWVLKLSTRGKPYRMKMRLPNVYRIARRFMSALKRAGKLIRPWWKRNVTAVKPSLVEQEEVLLSAPESFGICRSRWRKMYALGIDRCRGCWRKLRYRNLRYLVRSRLLHLEPVW